MAKELEGTAMMMLAKVGFHLENIRGEIMKWPVAGRLLRLIERIEKLLERGEA